MLLSNAAFSPLNDPPGQSPAKKAKLAAERAKVADLDYETWRQDMIFSIYGPQSTSLVRLRRGRAD